MTTPATLRAVMKNPEGYPTPLTDAQAQILRNPVTGCHEFVLADFARDLERKLSLAKEALEDVNNHTSKFQNLNVDNDDDWQTFKLWFENLVVTLSKVNDALAATAPTP